MRCDLVAIGASWGGLAALQTLLCGLDGDFAAPICVAQHRSPRADDTLLPSLLGRRTALTVRDAEDKAHLRPGTVLIAPPDYHMLVERGDVALSTDAPVAFSRPSIDVLLESAAAAYGDRLVGVVLTGSNADGAAGLAEVHRRGGLAIVQDPGEAERREMPDAALASVPTAEVLPLAEIAARLNEVVGWAARRARA
ncbi:MAG: chemotaxis protein CheB [Actinobacteria bacterium]|nr:MAG: chemotaxis protein CheB [Actinomycetota bacterium]